MYSEKGRHASVPRANDEFLRRMIGGEVVRTELPVISMETPTLPGDGQGGALCDGSIPGGECPTHLHAPALAMVYAPMQCWRDLLDLQSALKNGTLFADLVLPFEAGSKLLEGEVKPRR